VIEQRGLVDGLVGEIHFVPGVARALTRGERARGSDARRARLGHPARGALGLSIGHRLEQSALPRLQAARVGLEIERVAEGSAVVCRKVVFVELTRPLGARTLLHRGGQKLRPQIFWIHRQP